MKKTVTLMLALFSLLLLLTSCKNYSGIDSIFGPAPVGTGTVGGTDGLEYMLNNAKNEYYVIGIGTCTSKTIIVPSMHEGLPVTKIERAAFMKTDITSIKVSSGIKEIGDNAFSGCAFLKAVSLPQGLTSIGSAAFLGCNSLTEISLPKSLKTLENSAFKSCIALCDVQIAANSNLIEIPVSCFEGCLALEKVSLLGQSALTRICERAFYECPMLVTLSFAEERNSLKLIDSNAFYGCYSLSDLDFLRNSSVSMIKSVAFGGCTSITSVTLPDSCEVLEPSVFSGCSALREVHISKTMRAISALSFYDCSLDKVTVDPSSPYLSSAGNCVMNKEGTVLFLGTNYSLIPDTVQKINDLAFYSCSMLEKIILPEALTEIGVSAFEKCESLTEIELPDSVTKIGGRAFFSCINLSVLRIGRGLTDLSYDSFRNLHSLVTVNVHEDNPVLSSEGNVLTCRKGDDTLLLCGTPTAVIPEGVTIIGQYAFQSIAELKKIHVPASVRLIEQFAFDGCSALTELTFDKESLLEEIESYAFARTAILSVSLPDSVKRINSLIFSGCQKLKLVSLPLPEDIAKPNGSKIPFNSECTSLTKIYFGGTVAEWNSIEHEFSTSNYYVWHIHCVDVVVICSDGEITYK